MRPNCGDEAADRLRVLAIRVGAAEAAFRRGVHVLGSEEDLAAREAFTKDLNALWLLAEQSGITEQLVREYARRRRYDIRASGVDRADLSAEATLAMRQQCIGWSRTDLRTPLAVYARPGITRALTTFIGREANAATGVGVKAARRAPKRSNRVPLDNEDDD